MQALFTTTNSYPAQGSELVIHYHSIWGYDEHDEHDEHDEVVLTKYVHNNETTYYGKVTERYMCIMDHVCD